VFDLFNSCTNKAQVLLLAIKFYEMYTKRKANTLFFSGLLEESQSLDQFKDSVISLVFQDSQRSSPLELFSSILPQNTPNIPSILPQNTPNIPSILPQNTPNISAVASSLMQSISSISSTQLSSNPLSSFASSMSSSFSGFMGTQSKDDLDIAQLIKMGNFKIFLTAAPSLEEVIHYVSKEKLDDFNGRYENQEPPLAIALKNCQVDVINYLIQRGANVDGTDQNGNPLLFFCLTLPQHLRTDMFKLLLQKGANPLILDNDSKSLKEHLSDSEMLYWLQQALTFKIYAPDTRKKFEEANILNFLECYFSLVGQEIGIEAILHKICAKYIDLQRDKGPVALLLVGNHGHGKSEIGKFIGGLLAPSHCITLNCATISDEKWGLLGTAMQYVGQTNELSGFFKEHDGKMGLCVLKDFEKLGPNARDALIHIFKTGKWPNYQFRESKPYDCSKLIFILTTNMINHQLTEMLGDLPQQFAKQSDIEKRNKMKYDILDTAEQLVKNEMKKRNLTMFGEFLSVVPFISFWPLAQKIIVLEEQRKLATRYCGPPEKERKVGNLQLHFSGGFTKKIVEGYDPLLGASGLQGLVKKQVDRILLDVIKDQHSQVFFYIEDGDIRYSFSEPIDFK